MKTKRTLKIVVFLVLAIILKNKMSAQSFKGLDESPHDISYYRISRVTPPLAKVIYGRPQKKGQKIFGNLVEYGKLWKTGANEVTEIQFFQDVVFGGVKVAAGTYILFTIPGEKEWEVILSDNLNVKDTSEYFRVFDVARIKVPSYKAEALEVFSIAFKEKKDDVQMVLGWDSTRIKIPISFKSKELYAKL